MINKIDFNQLYINQKQNSTFKPKNVHDWDKKASSISKRIHKSIYNKELIEQMNFEGCETFLDVGCGVGNISLLVADKFKKIYSLDFSKNMLEILENEAKKRDIDNIETIRLSWEESWENVPKCDIILASRSMEVSDMKDALVKLNEKANKRVYLTYKVGGSFIGDDILEYIGKKINKKPDFIYTVNILYQMGIMPSINYIKSEGRKQQYTDEESFVQSIVWSIGNLNEKQMELLRKYYHEKLKDKKEQDSDYVCWAVIHWDKKSLPCL
jgi:SAM-dependent methyltransferase